MKLHLKKSFLKSKTLWGALIAASGGTLVPFALANAPVILGAIGLSPHTAGAIVTVGGAALAAYGRVKAAQALG